MIIFRSIFVQNRFESPICFFFVLGYTPDHQRLLVVEEKFGEQNFRILSEMRILAKIKVVVLDLVGYVEILTKFGAKSDFRV